jgi:3-hydroxybutyryl-CoA dehydrogenase
MSYQVKSVGIIGAGMMGTGIAEVSALAGYPTVLVKATGGDPGRALAKVKASIDARVAKGKLDASLAEQGLANLTVTADRAAIGGCNLVIEAIVEELIEKRTLFAALDAMCAEDAVFASNTSTLKIGELAAGIRDTRTIGLHFFSPVPAMNLVEVAHLAHTPPDVLAGAEAFVAALGKTAVPVLDSTGFIVNRLLVPFMLNAITAYGHGLAGADQIDTAMRLGCAHPMGPLALADFIGLDIVFAMAKLLYKEFNDACYKPPALLRRMVQDGQLGKKSGLGFYDYSAKPAVPHAALWELVRGGGVRRAA